MQRRTARAGVNVHLMYYIGKAIKTTQRRRETEWDASSASHALGVGTQFIKFTKKEISALASFLYCFSFFIALSK